MGSQMPAGRWPANVLLNHHEDCVALGTREVKSHNPDNKTLVGDDTTVHAYGKYQTRSPVGHAVDGKETIEVWECVDACPVRMLGGGDAQSGVRRSSGVYPGDGVLFSDGDGGDVVRAGRDRHRPNAGGASRFFYNGKVSKRERNAGMPEGEINDHATVKPIEVMQWLITLITPPGGRVLDPFLGSGTTAVAAAVLGFEMVGVELSAHHLDIAGHRVRHVGVDPVRIIGLGGLS